MIICKDYQEHSQTNEDDKTIVDKKKVPYQLDEYLWPHGITPPLKNIRKQRFRKTLMKNNTDSADIDKEVLFNIILTTSLVLV